MTDSAADSTLPIKTGPILSTGDRAPVFPELKSTAPEDVFNWLEEANRAVGWEVAREMADVKIMNMNMAEALSLLTEERDSLRKDVKKLRDSDIARRNRITFSSLCLTAIPIVYAMVLSVIRPDFTNDQRMVVVIALSFVPAALTGWLVSDCKISGKLKKISFSAGGAVAAFLLTFLFITQFWPLK